LRDATLAIGPLRQKSLAVRACPTPDRSRLGCSGGCGWLRRGPVGRRRRARAFPADQQEIRGRGRRRCRRLLQTFAEPPRMDGADIPRDAAFFVYSDRIGWNAEAGAGQFMMSVQVEMPQRQPASALACSKGRSGARPGRRTRIGRGIAGGEDQYGGEEKENLRAFGLGSAPPQRQSDRRPVTVRDGGTQRGETCSGTGVV
jgi:hypothetical protein